MTRERHGSIAAFLFLASACAAPVAGEGATEAPGGSKATPSRLTGYLDVAGETGILFESREALQQDDFTACRNLGADAATVERLRALAGLRVRIEADDLGTSYVELFNSGEIAIYRLRGRRIEPWCRDAHIYWVRTVEAF